MRRGVKMGIRKRSKTFKNIQKRSKIFENIQILSGNVRKYLKIFDYFVPVGEAKNAKQKIKD